MLVGRATVEFSLGVVSWYALKSRRAPSQTSEYPLCGSLLHSGPTVIMSTRPFANAIETQTDQYMAFY